MWKMTSAIAADGRMIADRTKPLRGSGSKAPADESERKGTSHEYQPLESSKV